MKSNQAKMTTVLGDELAKKFPRLLEDNHIASKAEILEVVRQNWDDNQKDIKLGNESNDQEAGECKSPNPETASGPLPVSPGKRSQDHCRRSRPETSPTCAT